MSDQDQVAPESARSGVVERGPYVLKTLLEDVPLSADGDREDIVINCIEYWGMCYQTAAYHSSSKTPVLVLWANWLQRATCMLEHPPPRFYTLYKYLPTPPTIPMVQHIYWRRGSVRRIQKRRLRSVRVCNKSSSSPQPTRLAYYATRQ